MLNANMELMAILFPKRNLIVDRGALVVTVRVVSLHKRDNF